MATIRCYVTLSYSLRFYALLLSQSVSNHCHLSRVNQVYIRFAPFLDFKSEIKLCSSQYNSHFTSFSGTSSMGDCKEFTKSFRSVTVSSHSSYPFPLNSAFLRKFLYPFFSCMSESSFGFLLLCSGLPDHFRISLTFLQHAQTVSFMLNLSFL